MGLSLLPFGIIILYVVKSLTFQGTNATYATELRCMLCKDAYSVYNCSEVAICDAATNYCYMELSVIGSVSVYNGGCRSRSVCHTASCLSSKTKRFITCSECCQGHFCNFHLCNADPVKNITTKLCYNCHHHEDPRLCRDHVVCESDEICKVEVVADIHTIPVRKVYVQRCEKESICNRRSSGSTVDGGYIIVGSVCCNNTLCNFFDPITESASDGFKFGAAIPPDNFRCPSTASIGHSNIKQTTETAVLIGKKKCKLLFIYLDGSQEVLTPLNYHMRGSRCT